MQGRPAYAKAVVAVPLPSTVTISCTTPRPGPAGATQDTNARFTVSFTTKFVQGRPPMVTDITLEPGGAKFCVCGEVGQWNVRGQT